MKLVGLSNGVFFRQISSVSIEAIKKCKTISTEAIEIGCITGLNDGHHKIDKIDSGLLIDFDFISLHAPSSKVIYKDNRDTHKLLKALQKTTEKLPIKHVVFHPDTIMDWKVFRGYDFKLAIENMDQRKSFGITVSQLKKVFDLLDCDFVLDLNHCYTIDHTMKLADTLLKYFSDKLCEVHVSGYTNYHDMLYQTKQTEISRYLNQFEVPIIIESVSKSPSDIAEEYNYIKSLSL